MFALAHLDCQKCLDGTGRIRGVSILAGLAVVKGATRDEMWTEGGKCRRAVGEGHPFHFQRDWLELLLMLLEHWSNITPSPSV